MELIEKLVNIQAPSGNEQKLHAFIKELTQDFADEVLTDALGNLILHKKGNGRRVMLTAHLDEPGFFVTVIEESGKARFSYMGSFDAPTLVNTRVQFLNGSIGVICADDVDKPTEKDLYIDTFGSQISVGDIAVFCSNPTFKDELVCSKALCSRAACYVLVNVIERLMKSNYDLYYVFTTQRELNSRGATVAAEFVSPEISISIDYSKADDKSIAVNKGSVVVIKDKSIISHSKIKTALIEAANELKCDIQLEVNNETSGDAGRVALSNAGSMCGKIAIPIKYCGLENQICSMNDIKQTQEILIKTIEGEKL